MARLKELGNHEVYSPEDYRKYNRRLKKTLAELINELECRADEISGLAIGMVKYCKAKKLPTGERAAWARAMLATKGLRVAAMSVRAALWASSKLYADFEKHFGVELNSMREEAKIKREQAQARAKAKADADRRAKEQAEWNERKRRAG